MSKTVYLLGAGVNRGLINAKGLKPPLDGDFFRLLADQGEALQGEAIPKGPAALHSGSGPGDAIPPFERAREPGNIHRVYGFIQRFWRMSPQDLAREPFSLEELLTLLQLKQRDAQEARNDSEAKEWLFCELVLEHRLLSYLRSFSGVAKADRDLAELGRIVYRDQSTVITTNYDAIVEEVIDEASNPDRNAHGNEHVSAWNERDAYCVNFKEPNEYKKEPKLRMVSSKRIRPMVLKLHGSLNWATYRSVAGNCSRVEEDIVFYASQGWTQHLFGYIGGQYLLGTLIAPPMLYKGAYYRHSAIRSGRGPDLRQEC